MKKFFLLLSFTFIVLFGQSKHSVSGQILDYNSGEKLSFANVKVKDQTIGTSADKEGLFKLSLVKGNYDLIFSFIGYKSDTVNVDLSKNTEINPFLKKINLEIQPVTVTPGINPAIALVRKAIMRKNERNEKLNTFVVSAYTKGVVRSDKKVEAGTGELDVSLFSGSDVKDDSTKLEIVGILENESKGYFKSPDKFRDEIIARKQTANFPSTLNILTGGRTIQSFYDEDLNVTGVDLPSPIADDALDYYYYYIEDSLAYDQKKVYQLYFAPDNANDPGFIGRIYIFDETYDLAKIDVAINSAANPGGLFKELNVFQQFLSYEGFYMPVDYRLFGEISFMGIIKMSFEVSSILSEYQINKSIDDSKFDMTILSVKPDADQKDLSYWESIQTLPITFEEQQTYFKMDSLMNVPYNFWEQFSPLSFQYNLGKNYNITAPLGMYGFNKIEGHNLSAEFSFSELMDKRLWGSLSAGYGFSDKKWKGEFRTRYLLGDLRTSNVEFSVYRKLNDLFGESIQYSNFFSTILNLFAKEDFRDYYYSSGFNLKYNTDVGEYFRVGLGFLNRTDKNAVNNSNFSFFYKDEKYTPNKQIIPTRINAITGSFRLDFRKFIEDGYYRRRTSQGNSFTLLRGDFLLARKGIGSSIDYNRFSLNSFSRVNLWGSAAMRVNIDAVWYDNAVPYQLMYALPGVMTDVTKPNTFRSLDIGEAVGDRAITAHMIFDFQDELIRTLGLKFLQPLDLTMKTHISFGFVEISEESGQILNNDIKTFSRPLIEAGFSIGQKLVPFNLDFTWRLTHKTNSGFIFGINAEIL